MTTLQTSGNQQTASAAVAVSVRPRLGDSASKHGRIAFIATPRFRENSPNIIADFVYEHLYGLCTRFEVMTTGRTSQFLKEKILTKNLDQSARSKISSSMALPALTESDVSRWREIINASLKPTLSGFQGMIHVAYDLVEQRLNAVIHFTDWEDKSAKPDSAVLAREANVHDVPISHDPDTARAHIRTWERRLLSAGCEPVFRTREQPFPRPLNDLEANHKVLAMVAHDNMKLEICRFAVEHAAHILTTYDYVLATGTTGGWIRRFLEAAGRSPNDVQRIRLCNSGPKGGDIQIAYAVVKGICRKIVFLQDPSVSHPHDSDDSDIRLFEQAVLAPDVHVELATNVESARLLIGT